MTRKVPFIFFRMIVFPLGSVWDFVIFHKKHSKNLDIVAFNSFKDFYIEKADYNGEVG